MAEFRFYHLTRSPLDHALPQLLGKALEQGMRAVVMTVDADRVAFLNKHLWTFDPGSFLPHGAADDGNADRQPIWLTDQPENPNAADLLILTDGAEHPEPDSFGLCCIMFDGHNQSAVERARAAWRRFRDAGHALTYWQQGERGGWEKKA